MDNKFRAQDYSFDEEHRITHFKYVLAPQVLTRLAQILPELPIPCSFQWRNHPECDKLKTLGEEWIRIHFGGDILNISCDKWIDAEMALLATMTMAGGRSDRMPAAVKLVIWFSMLDNLMDEPALMGADMGASQLMVDAVMTVFRNTVAVGGGDAIGIIKSGDDDPEIIVGTDDEEYNDSARAMIRVLRESARDWWEEMRRLGMSPRQQHRFLSAVERYLEASMKQVAFRQLRHVPNGDTYKEVRLQSIGWYVSSVILEFVWGLDPPDAIVEHPLLSALKVAASSHIMFVNDIFSFPKELSDGDIMNLVPVLAWHNLGRSQHILPLHSVEPLVQETVSQVLGLVREADEYVLLMAMIRAAIDGGVLGQEAATVERYVQGVSDWLSGCLQWHRISRRYVNNNNNNNNNNNPSISIGI